MSVSGGAPTSLTLWANETLIATVAAPFVHDWDTKGWTEGTYQLTARAESWGRRYASAAKSVTVDRTPPTVVGHVPGSDVTNVWSRDPITLTFSEPILGTTVDLTSVQYFVGGVVQAAGLSLSPSADTGPTVRVSPVALPDVSRGSATVGVNLSTRITDLAGNRLAPATWSWTVPDWQDLGVAGQIGIKSNVEATLAVDAEGAPLCALWYSGVFTPSQATLQRFDGKQWVAAPGRPFAATSTSRSVALDCDDMGRIAVAYVEPSSSSVYATVWNGMSPGDAGVTSVKLSDGGYSPAIRFDSNGHAMAAWFDTSSTDGIRTKLWSDGEWVDPPSLGAIAASASSLEVSLGLGGNPVVSWIEPSSRPRMAWRAYASGAWGGSTASMPFAASRQILRVDPTGAPLAAWVDTESPALVNLSRYPSLYAGWQLVGNSSLNVDKTKAAVDVALGVGRENNPVVVWTENLESGTALFAKQWNGTSWRQLGGNLFTGTYSLWRPFVAIGATNVVAVGYFETSPTRTSVSVKRFNQ